MLPTDPFGCVEEFAQASGYATKRGGNTFIGEVCMRRFFTVAGIGLLLCCFANPILADDWPQWLGPQRDSIWRETGIVKSIPKTGLPVKWRVPVAGGYSGPAVVGSKVYLTDFLRAGGKLANNPQTRNELEGIERTLCFDATSGKEIWKHEHPCKYSISYACGPRATPTVADGKVYALGAEGNLWCLDAETGKPMWSKDFKVDYKVATPIWGFAGQPLVDGQKLICLVGGEGSVAVAFHKDTGAELWRALSATEPGYSAPTMIEAGGVRQLLIWHPEGLNSLNPETGKLYWSQPLQPSYGMSIMPPRKLGKYLFASGIGDVGALYELDSEKPAAKEVWRSTIKSGVYCANSPPFLEDGMIYGCCCKQGQLRGVKLLTAERLWETFQPTTGDRRGGHGTAFIVKHGNGFFLFSETGDLILAKMSEKGYEEQGRFHVLEPTGECFGRPVVWSHPAFANQSLYARNDAELVCVSLAESQGK
jgi:outer membrane protein assembly factor BamB